MADRGGNNNVVLATGSHDGSIRFWQAAAGVSNRTIQPLANETQVNCLTSSPDKSHLAAGGHQTVRIFDAVSLQVQPVVTYSGHTNNVTSIAYQSEGKWLATSSEDGTVKIWDPRAPEPQRELICNSPVTSLALHPNQVEVVLCDDDGSMRIWDLTANRTVLECTPEESISNRSVAVAPDASQMALANHAGKCYVWKLTTARTVSLEPMQKIDASTSFLTKVLFSPNSQYLATLSADRSCKLWSPSNNFELKADLYDHHGWVWDAAFSADSAYIVTASSDRTAKLWDLATSDVLLEYRGHTRGLTAVTLNDT